MKILHFHYEMELKFSEPASNHRFSLKCLPVSDDLQELQNCTLEISPACKYSYSKDSFENCMIYGVIEAPHDSFRVSLTGDALTGKKDCRPMKENMISVYRYPSAMTEPGDTIRTFYASRIVDPDWDPLQLADYYTSRLFACMQYQPQVTSTETTAEQAMEMRSGVCQDYAHIMIALMRLHGIPARYVVGFMKGEGASHAWVEVGMNGYWYGFDPTNGKRVDDTYLHLSCGRDAKDCLMNRGVLTGGGYQIQTVRALVTQDGGENDRSSDISGIAD